MSTPRAWITVVGSSVFATVIAAEPTKYSYVGDIPAICPITINKHTTELPVGFRISPEDAVKRASEKTNIRCNSIFEQLVYADSQNYYIIRSIHGPMSDKVEAVVVDGRSGDVRVRK